MPAGRFPRSDLPPYIVAQVVGAIAGARPCSTLIASGKPGFELTGGFAANGYGEHSPGRLLPARRRCVAEVVLTFMFLIIILGATTAKRARGLRADRDRPRR